MTFTLTYIIAYSVFAVVIVIFCLCAWKDVFMLFRRPTRGMGTGFSRIWAVARTTVAEAWAGRVWLLPALWLAAVLILMLVVVPYDKSERIPLYLRVLITGQEWLLLVMMWVLACISFPRERERKILVTNASKPLSRLELFLGKVVGFSVTAALLLVIMGLMSYAIITYADFRNRRAAAEEYVLAESDYQQALEKRRQESMASSALKLQGGTAQKTDIIVPSESLKKLSEEGSLFAYNYITVPKKTGFSIVGMMDFASNPPTRYLKGGSQEKVIYHFATNLTAPPEAIFGPPGSRPFFFFFFPVQLGPHPPSTAQVNVIVRRTKAPLHQQEKSLTLDSRLVAQWEPDRPDELFSPMANGKVLEDLGPVDITLSCPTPGVYLNILDGKPSGQPNVCLVPIRTSANAIWPDPEPQMLGFERRDQQQVAGPDPKEGGAWPEMAVYRFKGADLNPAKLPLDSKGDFTVAMALDIDKQDNRELDTQCYVRAYNEFKPNDIVERRFDVIEKRVNSLKLPSTLLGNETDPSKRGDVVILVMCATPGHWISLNEQAIRIELPQSSFLLNLFKSEAVIFLEITLLVLIGVTCSIRLGWPVAMLMTGLCYMLGNFAEVVADWQSAAKVFANPQGNSGILNMDNLQKGALDFLGLLVAIMPDFTRMEPLKYLVDLRDMPWSYLGYEAALVALFSLPFIALGYMLIRKQELG